jgi:hypothetical protein
MKKEIKNIPASIRSRLGNKAREMGVPFAEILQYFCMERFLYRFGKSKYANKFILKGALMFTAWQIPERRTTLDIDLLAHFDNKVTTIENVIKDICLTEVISDGVIFDTDTVRGQKMKEDADYEGVRVKFTGFLEQARIPMQIDIGFGDKIYPGPKIINYPVILNLPNPKIKGYPVESMISEKFEAMVKLGELNSRMKDFYDIWLLMRLFNFEGPKLVEALKRTFKQRKTDFPSDTDLFAEEIYDKRSDKQVLWKAFIRKGDIKSTPEKLAIVAKRIEHFLCEPVEAANKKEPFTKNWIAAKSWE